MGQKWKIAALLSLSLVVSLTACGSTVSKQNDSPVFGGGSSFDASTPKTTVENFLKALGAGDSETALKYVSESDKPDSSNGLVSKDIASKATGRISNISVGEGENDSDGKALVEWKITINGKEREGDFALAQSPEGGYRIDSSLGSDDASSFFPAITVPCGGMKSETRLIPGTYSVDCKADWGTAKVTVVADNSQTDVTPTEIKVTDKDAMKSVLEKMMASSFNQNVTSFGYEIQPDGTKVTIKDLKEVTPLPKASNGVAFKASGDFVWQKSTGELRPSITFGTSADLPGFYIVQFTDLMDKNPDSYVGITNKDLSTITRTEVHGNDVIWPQIITGDDGLYHFST